MQTMSLPGWTLQQGPAAKHGRVYINDGSKHGFTQGRRAKEEKTKIPLQITQSWLSLGAYLMGRLRE